MLRLMIILAMSLLQSSNWNVNKKGYVAEGYDVVSYFNGAPMEGSKKFRHEYKGVTFLFATTENLNTFKEKPQKYLPQYGGWCAYAMADSGDKVSVNPETYTITDGKLYLFYNSWGTNTLNPWKENEGELIKKSTINWQTKYEH
ncbi:MAG: YHS domain-containing (seleno)protein [Marinoscillum sp.]